MMLVRIIAPEPVQYSLCNGVGPPTEFDPGEVYKVPEYVARGMFARGWAREVTPDEVDSFEQPTELPSLAELKGDKNVNASD